MAQRNISLPIRFEYKPVRLEWTVCSARLRRLHPPEAVGGISFRSSLLRRGLKQTDEDRDPLLEWCITSPNRYKGTQIPVRASEVPGSVLDPLATFISKLDYSLDNREVQVLLGTNPSFTAKGRYDPWSVRDEFRGVKESAALLAKCLSDFGCWSAAHLNISSEGAPIPSVIVPQEIWLERRTIREAVHMGAAKWFELPTEWLGVELDTLPGVLEKSLYPLHFAASERRPTPHLVHTTLFCRDAIVTSYTVDFLNDVEFQICARCGDPFSKRNGKMYCNHTCAHYVSVTRKRRERREAARSGSGALRDPATSAARISNPSLKTS